MRGALSRKRKARKFGRSRKYLSKNNTQVGTGFYCTGFSLCKKSQEPKGTRDEVFKKLTDSTHHAMGKIEQHVWLACPVVWRHHKNGQRISVGKLSRMRTGLEARREWCVFGECCARGSRVSGPSCTTHHHGNGNGNGSDSGARCQRVMIFGYTNGKAQLSIRIIVPLRLFEG